MRFGEPRPEKEPTGLVLSIEPQITTRFLPEQIGEEPFLPAAHGGKFQIWIDQCLCCVKSFSGRFDLTAFLQGQRPETVDLRSSLRSGFVSS